MDLSPPPQKRIRVAPEETLNCALFYAAPYDVRLLILSRLGLGTLLTLQAVAPGAYVAARSPRGVRENFWYRVFDDARIWKLWFGYVFPSSMFARGDALPAFLERPSSEKLHRIVCQHYPLFTRRRGLTRLAPLFAAETEGERAHYTHAFAWFAMCAFYHRRARALYSPSTRPLDFRDVRKTLADVCAKRQRKELKKITSNATRHKEQLGKLGNALVETASKRIEQFPLDHCVFFPACRILFGMPDAFLATMTSGQYTMHPKTLGYVLRCLEGYQRSGQFHHYGTSTRRLGMFRDAPSRTGWGFLNSAVQNCAVQNFINTTLDCVHGQMLDTICVKTNGAQETVETRTLI